MKKIAILLALTLAAGVVLAQQAEQRDLSSILNFLRINKEICTGGQPSMDDLAKLKEEGVRAIINLRRPTEYNAEEEAAKAKELGLRYFSIPVSVAEPKDEQADEFLKIMSDTKNRPAFIHCATANRVGGFWMVRRVLVDGWKIDDAEAEARKIGLHSPSLVEFAHSYIERHPKKPR
jgi:protein tyrosine phosphatase (PTP) superfamily phosphohydrolase (DUF442 family)